MDVPPRYHPCMGHLGTLHGWVTKVPWYCVLLESEQRNPQKKSALKHLTNALFGSGSSVNNDYSVDHGSFPLLVVLLSCVVLRCIVLRCIVLCCNLLCCFVLNCVALYCIALRCIALHCVALLPSPRVDIVFAFAARGWATLAHIIALHLEKMHHSGKRTTFVAETISRKHNNYIFSERKALHISLGKTASQKKRYELSMYILPSAMGKVPTLLCSIKVEFQR